MKDNTAVRVLAFAHLPVDAGGRQKSGLSNAAQSPAVDLRSVRDRLIRLVGHIQVISAAAADGGRVATASESSLRYRSSWRDWDGKSFVETGSVLDTEKGSVWPA